MTYLLNKMVISFSYRLTSQCILGKIQAIPMAKGITTQFTERLNESHSIFETSMDQLLKLHQARLGQVLF